MSTEIVDTDLDNAFEGGFADETPEPSAPAADAAAPASPADGKPADQGQGSAATDDELAGLPPKVRAMLTEFESVKQAAALVPTLEHKLRSAEGRVAALQKAMPAPPPPAPPRLEKVERVRAELPEVAEAIEEYAQHAMKSLAPQQASPAEEAPLLSEAMPGWEQKVASKEFAEWLDQQGGEYASKVKSTASERVMLEALTRFDVMSEFAKREAARRAEEADRLGKTRQSRAAAAAVPAGAGRRAPAPPSTLDDEFEAGFRS